jgi:hypothetical protein
MKRQTVIKIVANYFYELNVDYDECEKEAERLVSELESQGLDLE